MATAPGEGSGVGVETTEPSARLPQNITLPVTSATEASRPAAIIVAFMTGIWIAAWRGARRPLAELPLRVLAKCEYRPVSPVCERMRGSGDDVDDRGEPRELAQAGLRTVARHQTPAPYRPSAASARLKHPPAATFVMLVAPTTRDGFEVSVASRGPSCPHAVLTPRPDLLERVDCQDVLGERHVGNGSRNSRDRRGRRAIDGAPLAQ
jgi:hypothetical protein